MIFSLFGIELYGLRRYMPGYGIFRDRLGIMIWICWVSILEEGCDEIDAMGLIVEVGNRGLSLEEQRTHFNLWALSKSPLLIGTHVSRYQRNRCRYY